MSVVRTLIGNVKGPQGEQGEQGTRGPAGTIEVGSVQTVSYGSAASVTNSGTDTEAILDFQIPQGAPGATVTDMSNLVLSSITDTTADYPTFAVGETGSTIFGKIRKFLSDLKEKYVSKSMMTASTNVDTEGQYVADAKAINSLNTSLSNLSTDVSTNYATKTDLTNIVKVDQASGSISLAAGEANASVTLTIPTISGYTPISVLDHTVSGSGSTGVVIYGTWLRSETTIGYKIKNQGTGTATPNANFRILYMKTAFVS